LHAAVDGEAASVTWLVAVGRGEGVVVSTCMPDELVRGRGAGGHHTRCGPWPAFISAFGGGGCLFCLCVL
jgi:hypothetical protein